MCQSVRNRNENARKRVAKVVDGVTHVLEKIKRFMQVDGGRGGLRVAQLRTPKKVSLHMRVVFRKSARTRTAVTPHILQY